MDTGQKGSNTPTGPPSLPNPHRPKDSGDVDATPAKFQSCRPLAVGDLLILQCVKQPAPLLSRQLVKATQ